MIINNKTHINLGNIYREHGVKGYCKFYAQEGCAANLVAGQVCVLKKDEQEELSVVVVDVMNHGKYFLVKFDCFDSPEDIIPWRKATLWVDKKAVTQDENKVFDDEWEGFVVIDQNKQKIGAIKSIVHNPLKQFLIDQNAREILIPFVEDWFISVDKEKNEIQINLPEGLIEL